MLISASNAASPDCSVAACAATVSASITSNTCGVSTAKTRFPWIIVFWAALSSAIVVSSSPAQGGLLMFAVAAVSRAASVLASLVVSEVAFVTSVEST